MGWIHGSNPFSLFAPPTMGPGTGPASQIDVTPSVPWSNGWFAHLSTPTHGPARGQTMGKHKAHPVRPGVQRRATLSDMDQTRGPVQSQLAQPGVGPLVGSGAGAQTMGPVQSHLTQPPGWTRGVKNPHLVRPGVAGWVTMGWTHLVARNPNTSTKIHAKSKKCV